MKRMKLWRIREENFGCPEILNWDISVFSLVQFVDCGFREKIEETERGVFR